MAIYNSKNVLVGAAAIFVGDADATPPAPTATDRLAEFMGTAAPEDWRSVGFTSGGVEVTYAPDFGEVEVDQLLDAAVMFKQRMSVTVGTTLAEATLENFVFAWGQSDESLGAGVLTIESGDLGDRPIERQLLFSGQAPAATGTDTERVYHLYRALNVESSAHSLSRAEMTGIPVSLRCLPDNDGKYGTITDRTITTTGG